jgi:ATP-binding cassette subfamily B protein
MSNKKHRLSSLRYLLAYLSPYKLQLTGASIALIVTSSMTLILGQGIRYLIDNGFGTQSLGILNKAILLLMGLALISSLGTYVRFYLVSWLGERVSADIRKAVFDHIVSLHPSYFEANRSGEIASRITTDTTLLQTIIGSSFSMALRNFLTASGGLVMMFVTNIKLMVVLVVCVLLVIFPMRLLGRRVKALSRDSQDSIAEVGSHAGEIIQQIKTVQSYTQEESEKRAFGEHVEHAFAIAGQRIRQRAILMAAVMLLMFFSLSAMLWVGGGEVIRGTMSAGELAAFVFYALIVTMGVMVVSEVYGELQRAAGATERLIELLNVEPQITASSPKGGGAAQTAGSAALLPATLAFRNVDFYYPSRPQQAAITGFSLALEAGKSMALVGASGAGKSTIFELIQRFYDPQCGVIELGGLAIRQLSPQQLRQQLAVVAQTPALFTADVATNIRYGRPDATDEEVEAAAKAAFAHDFIMGLPNGYNSFLGEQGVRLSGGQKQRIAIARAILKAPRILMLDEATSALDSESERQVQRALEVLMQGRTTLVIAHRLSTVRHVDTIAVLDAGQLVAQGTHESLLATSALYRSLARHQFDESVSAE